MLGVLIEKILPLDFCFVFWMEYITIDIISYDIYGTTKCKKLRAKYEQIMEILLCDEYN